MAGLPNEFLGTAFEDRQTLLETANHDADQLKDVRKLPLPPSIYANVLNEWSHTNRYQ